MRRLLLPAAALSLSLLVGCSSNVEPDASAAESPTADPAAPSTPSGATTSAPAPAESEPLPADDSEAALEQAVTDYTNAYFAGDWDVAFERLWSDRCKADNDARNGFMGTLMAQEINYPGADKPQAGAVTIDRVEGDIAVVTYDFSFHGETQTITSQPWVRENGAWHYDAC